MFIKLLIHLGLSNKKKIKVDFQSFYCPILDFRILRTLKYNTIENAKTNTIIQKPPDAIYSGFSKEMAKNSTALIAAATRHNRPRTWYFIIRYVN